MLVGMFNRTQHLHAMFVFLVLPMLYPNDTPTGFAKAMKTWPAARREWKPSNSKRTLPVLK